MTCPASFFRSVMFLSVALVLSGCGASLSESDEQKEPHFLAGKSRASTMDYEGAIECFEKALQVNPQSASAHFELGWLYDQKELDPAAAIYHYKHYLELSPSAGNSELVKQRILTCKQELARTVSLGPITEKVQKEFEQLSEDNKRLTEENKRLHEDIEKWSAYARSLQALTNRSSSTPVVNRISPPTDLPGGASASFSQSNSAGGSPPPIGHSHTVKSGETPTLIARKYGIKLDALMAANPGLNPKRLHVGQALSIPTP